MYVYPCRIIQFVRMETSSGSAVSNVLTQPLVLVLVTTLSLLAAACLYLPACVLCIVTYFSSWYDSINNQNCAPKIFIECHCHVYYCHCACMVLLLLYTVLVNVLVKTIGVNIKKK